MKYLVGLSGGADSVLCLNKMVTEFGNDNVEAIYVNHNISENSKIWGEFCQNICDINNVKFHYKSVDGTHKKGESPEESARIARYNAYKEVLNENDVLVLGHHSDDVVENFLLQAFRGTGVEGLSSMSKETVINGGIKVFRPLFELTKEEIIKECLSLNLEWVEDESNKSSCYDRNFLRNEIIPQLKERFGNINKPLTRTVENCQEASEIINQNLKSFEGKKLNVKELSTNNSIRKMEIRTWIKNNGSLPPSKKVLEEIIKLSNLDKGEGKELVCFSNNKIRRYEEFLFLNDEEPFVINSHSNLVVFEDLNKKEKKKWKDYFKSKKIPPWKRNKALVLPEFNIQLLEHSF